MTNLGRARLLPSLLPSKNSGFRAVQGSAGASPSRKLPFPNTLLGERRPVRYQPEPVSNGRSRPSLALQASMAMAVRRLGDGITPLAVRYQLIDLLREGRHAL